MRKLGKVSSPTFRPQGRLTGDLLCALLALKAFKTKCMSAKVFQTSYAYDAANEGMFKCCSAGTEVNPPLNLGTLVLLKAGAGFGIKVSAQKVGDLR